jgi:hypothetical protein
MKTQLLNGETLSFSNDEDLLDLFFSKATKKFCIMLNAKMMFRYKSFNHIEAKLTDMIKDRKLSAEINN